MEREPRERAAPASQRKSAPVPRARRQRAVGSCIAEPESQVRSERMRRAYATAATPHPASSVLCRNTRAMNQELLELHFDGLPQRNRRRHQLQRRASLVRMGV